MTNNLKRCPFCGSIPNVVVFDEDRPITYEVTCPNPVCGPIHQSQEDAVEYWNGRPGEDALVAEVRRLTAERDAALKQVKCYQSTMHSLATWKEKRYVRKHRPEKSL